MTRALATLACLSLLFVAAGCDAEEGSSGPASYSGPLNAQGNTGLGVTAEEVTIDGGSTAGVGDAAQGGTNAAGNGGGGGLDIPGTGGADGAEDDGGGDEPSSGGIPGNTGGGSDVPGGTGGGSSVPGSDGGSGSGSSGGSSGGGIDIPGGGGGDDGPGDGGTTTDGCDERCYLCEEYVELMLDCAAEAGVPEELIAEGMAEVNCYDLGSDDPTTAEFDCLIGFVYYEADCSSVEGLSSSFEETGCEFEDGPVDVECDSDEVVDCWGECSSEYWLGDGSCDESFYCSEWDYDYGDCEDEPTDPVEPVECGSFEVANCWGGCSDYELLGDGECQEDFACSDLEYDYGDCKDDVLPGDCGDGDVKDCEGGCTSASWVDDGVCDESLLCEEFNFDGGDCDDEPTDPIEPGECGSGEVTNCEGGCTSAEWVADGVCDEVLLCEEFEFDGGDCKDDGGGSDGGGSTGTCDSQCEACLFYFEVTMACLEKADFPPIDGFDMEQCYSQGADDPDEEMYMCMVEHVTSLQCTSQEEVLEAMQSNPCQE